jgi:hypothetical protein
MYKALYISPMIPSRNLNISSTFFVEILGFEKILDMPTYIICQKDHLTIHFLPAGEEITQMEFYMEVDQVDALWNEIKDKIKHLKHKAPFDQEYKMLEIHIEIPETNTLLFIGQEIKNSDT